MARNPSIPRIINLSKDLEKKSILLLGPRRTGKSFLIRNQLKADQVYNLLRADTFQELSAHPSLIRESLKKSDRLIVIDEIQKLPHLMDEVHLMIEETSVHFLLTGSSARKLRTAHTSLMAGRAHTKYLFPFVSAELKSFSLMKCLRYGMLPPVVMGEDPEEIISTYVGDYLRDEIQAEALTRRIENFSRFLHQAAHTNSELINFESVAQDAQVPARTVREYYQVLKDTLIGTMLEPLSTSGKRKPVSHAKFYFFDVGVMNTLLGTFDLGEGHPLIGKCFEQFIFQEIRAYLSYFHPKSAFNFWRTQSGHEVDFVINGQIGIEVKWSNLVSERDVKGLRALSEETTMTRKIIVSRDKRVRHLGDIEVMPYEIFLKALWSGKILK